MRSRKMSQWHDINSERPDERAEKTHLSHLYIAPQEEKEQEADDMLSPWSTSGWSKAPRQISIANAPRYGLSASTPGRAIYGELQAEIQPRMLFAGAGSGNLRLVTGMLLVLSAFLVLVILTVLLM